MGLPALFDQHFPTHGNWQGLSLGWVTTIWLSAIVSRGDHRLVPVEPWVAKRLWTLRATTGQALERLDCTDARLAIVRRRLQDDTQWAAFASALHQHTVRVSALPTERGHVESPSASAYPTVPENGLLQCGHRKDDRPDLPHVQVMQAVLDPLGMPLATEVVAGARADAPLSMPCLQRVQASVGRRGRLYVGDGKMASRATRAFLAGQGDFSLCPLPQVQRAEGELEAALEAVWSGEHALSPVLRERQDGQPERMAEGYDSRGPMRLEMAGAFQSWTARRVVVRSMRQAQAAEKALRARVANAMAQIEARNHRGRGKPRFDAISGIRLRRDSS